jgi:tetratricopeptide (TPR) repeat protein
MSEHAVAATRRHHHPHAAPAPSTTSRLTRPRVLAALLAFLSILGLAAAYASNDQLRAQAISGVSGWFASTPFDMADELPLNRRLRYEAADLFMRKDWRGAERIYQELHRLEPESPDVWYGLALCRHHFGDYERAIEANKKALADPVLAPLAQFNLAAELALLGRSRDALAALDSAFRIGFRDLGRIGREPAFASLRHEPGFLIPPAPQLLSFTTRGGETVRYLLVLPRHFDPSRTYPALLGLPGSSQDTDAANFVLDSFWGMQASYHNWIVITPLAPERAGFAYADDLRSVPELLDHVAGRFRIEGGKFHLAGYSNGGTAAFMLATAHPDRFHSLTALPCYEIADDVFDRLEALAGMPVTLTFGELDDGPSPAATKRIHRRLTSLELDSTLIEYEGDRHAVGALMGDRFMRLLDDIRTRTLLGPAGARTHSRFAHDE